MSNLFELMMVEQQKQQLQVVLECNQKTQKFGLLLTTEDAKELMQMRSTTLKENKRVEFGSGILPEIIYSFCDSQYINQHNYATTIGELQEIFYLFKNESQDNLTDAELLDFMKTQYDGVCFGDLDYLKGTCLERFARAIRSGYQSQAQKRLRDEYNLRESDNEYSQFSEETAWEYELYKLKLEEMD